MKDLDIGVRALMAVPVLRVVPNVEVLGDLGPVFDVLLEGAVESTRTVGKGAAEIAFDGAQPDDDVVARSGVLWGVSRIRVSECVDIGIRKFAFDGFGYRVDETDDGACMTFFILIYGAARWAFTPERPIHLRNADDPFVGRGISEDLPDLFNGDVEHIRVGEAELRGPGVD